jgi:four helix bundle protein
MKVTRFEELHVWQRAQDLAVFVYDRLSDSKDFRFKSQITAACVSISNNIAEGFEQPTTINYVRYLNIARNSSNEVRSMSYLAVRLNYLKDDEGVHLRTECEAISKMLRAMNEKLLANIRQRNNQEPSS